MADQEIGRSAMGYDSRHGSGVALSLLCVRIRHRDFVAGLAARRVSFWWVTRQLAGLVLGAVAVSLIVTS